ncbi:MAG: nucleotidyltransferase domain-containing protein [Crocosphaera sp.]|nr:nucleotidyltransferase domain-containing protein [Crocosphaera sp.]
MNTLSKLNLPISLNIEKIHNFCQHHHIRKLSLFGSILREDFTENSDVDFLVMFDPDAIPGYLRLAAMELELSKIIKRKADLRTSAELSRYFRHKVEKEAVTIYVKN